MAQVVSTLEVPGRLAWADVSDDGLRAATGGTVDVPSGGASRRVSWVSRHYTFQVQWRVRRRYAPAKAAAVYGEVGEQWGEWGPWQGATVDATGEAKSECTRYPSLGIVAMDAPFEFAYSFGEWDAHEYQFRVRAFDEPTLNCSDWLTGTLRVLYRPSISLSATRNADGSVAVAFGTDWPRGGEASLVGQSALVPLPRMSRGSTASGRGESSTVEVVVPADCIAGLSASSAALNVGTARFRAFGGATATVARPAIPLAAHADDAEVTPPSVSVSEGAVSVADAGYDSVFCSASWEDDEGNAYSAEVPMSADGSAWEGAMECPPYDVPVSLRVAATVGAKWAEVSATATVPSRGRYTWTAEGSEASVTLHGSEAALSMEEEPDSATVKPVGRSRPVSRHGTGGARTLSFSGAVLRGRLSGENARFRQDGHADILRVLREPGDLWFRTPGGGRYRVRVAGFSITRSPDYEEVSVEMEEVV